MLILKSARVTHAYRGNIVNYLLDVGFVLDLNFADYIRPYMKQRSLSIVTDRTGSLPLLNGLKLTAAQK